MNENLITNTDDSQTVKAYNTNKYLINILLYVSFCVIAILPSFMLANESSGLYKTIGFTLTLEDKVFFVLLYALLLYGLYLLTLRIYILCMSFSIYAVLIPQAPFVKIFSIWYIIRNVVVGASMIFAMFYPIIYNYLNLFALVCDIFMFFGFFASFSKRYIDEITTPFAFRLFFRPYFVYLVLETLIMCLEVL